MTQEIETGAPAKPDPDEIRERAAAFLLKRHEYDWTAQDQADLDAWFAQGIAHRIAYLRLESAWGSADRLAVLRRPMREPQPDPKAGKSNPFLAKIAAGVAIVSIGLFAAAQFVRPGGVTYSTPVGGHEIVTLADGSKIELNTDTQIEGRIEGDARHVSLVRGEAYFQIKHDGAHPFVVSIGHNRVVDLGTKFLIRRDASQVQVTLLEGAARLETAISGSVAKAATLAPGDVAIATAGNLSVSRKPKQELPDELAWRRGVLVFRRTTLGDAAAEFNRYSASKLAITDPTVASLTISGTFPVGGIELFSSAARQSFGLHVAQRGGATVISRP